MSKNITIILYLFISLFFASCEEKKKDNSGATAAAFLLTRGSSATGGCASASTTAISNSSLSGTTPTATQYSITGCDTNSLSSIGFSSQSISTGLTGTSANSRILSNGDLFSGSDVNIEVTFKLNDASGYLEVIGHGSGTAASLDGTGVRINSSSTQARGGGSSTLTTINSQSTSVGATVTYCLDFHNESPNFHTVFWPSACTAVSTADRNSYTGREASVTSTFPGKRVGFILNNATLQSFTVRTKIGVAANLLNPQF
jgi:hypothetical protein